MKRRSFLKSVCGVAAGLAVVPGTKARTVPHMTATQVLENRKRFEKELIDAATHKDLSFKPSRMDGKIIEKMK